MKNQLSLVTGPARSGKSEWAEYLAQNSAKSVIYLATSTLDASDGEWISRIDLHRQRRPANWTTVEVPVELSAALRLNAGPENCLLVDSLGTWVANLLELDNASWESTLSDLILSAGQLAGEIIFVAEETGWGVVPAYPAGRLFRDRLGTLSRRLGTIADAVYLVTGGHVLNLSLLGHKLPGSK
ncbi:bifunctional adenosylcobinamide kinase/adenosylcobinamide-phosphate guanylyltransferase [Ancylothrix sp. C2]|uniref:bifunctional adenosylcobinamide kinase/adenosylcobinamide-phosphate guanylyltransferase n=1 Tax=Ancylothrix sp. D3o TaxID=2953691 RepID=UPI0021BAA81F|nr:bifunctional adenosylcobinamide kinase/adenosylcobinamide-phosphate guanylyltransferase [Ancylothrix sp. D3o]MCT7948728.1 bifunctional adenosylcobinamide kinase/adenosylcobinamide-phosphate guanylyltransferase [Ancylothrix sp. D3o]